MRTALSSGQRIHLSWLLNIMCKILHSGFLIPVMFFPSHIPFLRLYLAPTPSEPDSSHDADESWVKRPFYDLSSSMERKTMAGERDKANERDTASAHSSAIGRIPFLRNDIGSANLLVFFNGQVELIVQPKFRPAFTYAYLSSSENKPWYGDLVFQDQSIPSPYHFPRASKDGTRFLLQGRMRTPVVVDISQVVV
ncbi:uncharacterized protein EI90DRAFT_3042248 [Cantharellus anzutake]|uniref:uncharacterized protein n=1 Tax=Cantharellus anzutake TaxID=1750568 RepID=UPI0019043BC2|nr:uncharacterized protein EI90DRAFT_3042248 [Cantharellus anzutake]KAF8338244.1 hypothetical protein EI90DRAFT_3042248 [Cantharellus anzutake]